MTIILFIIVILVLLALAIYATSQIPQLEPFRGIIIALECVIAIIVIAVHAGIRI